jgi:filamentous hemagglutinin family protein
MNALRRRAAAGMAAAGWLTVTGPAMAQTAPPLPQEFVRRSGQVELKVGGTTMTIEQRSMAAKLDWKSFDIARGHTVRINQPGPDAFIVNRVTGDAASTIHGSLIANGGVYVVNPHGVVFGSTARVDVGSLHAWGARLSDAEMDAAGAPRLPEHPRSQVVHSGRIIVRDGGVAAFVAKDLRLESGSRIHASGARVALLAFDAAGDEPGSSQGSLLMDEDAPIHAFGGMVEVYVPAGKVRLGQVRTHELAVNLQDVPLPSRVTKDYDGKRLVGGLGRVDDLSFTSDSTLRLSLAAGDSQPGRQQGEPRLEFRDWLGEVSATLVPTPALSEVTIEPPGDAERARIDLPVFDRKLAGEATFEGVADGTMTIKQQSDHAVLDWKSFNIAEDFGVKFVQKDAASTVVNRVFDTEGSQIHGRLEANGKVFVFNPNGVLLGRTARVQLGGGGFLGFSLSDEQATDPAQGWQLSSTSTDAEVRNEGRIAITNGGVATLASPSKLTQAGLINAPQGTVNLVGGTAALSMQAQGGTVDPGESSPSDGLTHLGRTRAVGGTVRMSARSAGFVASGLIDVSDGGDLEVDALHGGSLDAHVRPGKRISIKGFGWRVPRHPNGFGPGELAANQIVSWLDAGSDVHIETSGRTLNVNAPIHASGKGGGSLTLRSRSHDVRLNSDISLQNGDLIVETGADLSMSQDASVSVNAGKARFSAKEAVSLSKVSAKALEIDAPVTVAFEAKDKVYDGTTSAEVARESSEGFWLFTGSNLKLRRTYRFDSAEPGERRVTPHLELSGFGGAPLRLDVRSAHGLLLERRLRLPERNDRSGRHR